MIFRRLSVAFGVEPVRILLSTPPSPVFENRVTALPRVHQLPCRQLRHGPSSRPGSSESHDGESISRWIDLD
jgi:hypothetical protein